MGVNRLGLGVTLDAKNKMSRPIDDAGRSLDKMKRKAKTTGRVVRSETDRMTAALSRYARGFTVGLKMTALGVGLAAPFYFLAKAAATTEHALAEVKSLLVSQNMPEPEMNKHVKALGVEVGRVSENYGVLYKEILLGAYPIVSAWGDMERSIAAVEPITKLALAGKGTITQTVDLVTSLEKTFGVFDEHMKVMDKAERLDYIADKVAGTIHRYKTTIPVLMSAMSESGGVTAAQGQDMVDMLSTTGFLHTRGLAGTKAGTGINAFFRGIGQAFKRMNESGDVANLTFGQFIKKAEGGNVGAGLVKALQNNPLTKMKMSDEFGRMLSPVKMVEEMEKAFGMTGKDAIAITLEQYGHLLGFIQDEGARAALAMVGSSAELKKITEEIRNSEAATAGADIVNQTFQSNIIKLNNTWHNTKKILGEVLLPLFDQLKVGTHGLLVGIRKWASANPTIVKTTAEVIGLVSALLILAGTITIVTFSFKSMKAAFVIIGHQTKWFYDKLKALGNLLIAIHGKLKLMAFYSKLAAVRLWLVSKATAAWGWAMAANPIMLTVLAVLALIGVLVLLEKKYGAITKLQMYIGGDAAKREKEKYESSVKYWKELFNTKTKAEKMGVTYGAPFWIQKLEYAFTHWKPNEYWKKDPARLAEYDSKLIMYKEFNAWIESIIPKLKLIKSISISVFNSIPRLLANISIAICNGLTEWGGHLLDAAEAIFKKVYTWISYLTPLDTPPWAVAVAAGSYDPTPSPPGSPVSEFGNFLQQLDKEKFGKFDYSTNRYYFDIHPAPGDSGNAVVTEIADAVKPKGSS